MSTVCFCSRKDLAAQAIKEQLLTLYSFKETDQHFDSYPIFRLDQLSLVTIEQDSIYADNLDQHFTANLFIFASRHKSAAFKPALLTHVPGNWADADLGGKASRLCIAPASAMKIALQTMLEERSRLKLTDWACGLEATHHGPFIATTPVLYIEIGSTEQEWQNPIATEIIARTIMTVSQRHKETYPTILGFGGPHYCPNFTRLCAETRYAIAHVLPKYHLQQLSESMVQHAMEQSSPSPTIAALDWKGMKGKQRDQVKRIGEHLGLETQRVDKLLHHQDK